MHRNHNHSWHTTGFVRGVTGVTTGARITYPSGTLELVHPRLFVVRVPQSVICRSMLFIFILAVVLSVLLLCKASDYPFNVFNLFLVLRLNRLCQHLACLISVHTRSFVSVDFISYLILSLDIHVSFLDKLGTISFRC